MRVLLQRVSRAEVRVHPAPGAPARVTGRIERGYLLLLGVSPTDTLAEAKWLAEKITSLRLFADTEGKMNLDLREVGGALLVVSQFTLYGDARKGRCMNLFRATLTALASALYEAFIALLRAQDLAVETGEFGAHMDVELINDGPVTLWLEREAGVPATE